MLFLKHRLYEPKIFTIYSKIVSELKESFNKLLNSIILYYSRMGVIFTKDRDVYNKCYFTYLGSKRYTAYTYRIDNVCMTMYYISLLYDHTAIIILLKKFCTGELWNFIISADLIRRGIYEPLKYLSINNVGITYMMAESIYHMYFVNYFMLKRDTNHYYDQCRNLKLREWLKEFYS